MKTYYRTLREIEASLPEEVVLTARWKQLKQRPDVQAAVRRVGRIESYPLFTY